MFCLLSAAATAIWFVRTINQVKHLQFSGSTLNAIAQALLLYQREHGELPDPDTWLDDLVAAGWLDPFQTVPTRADGDSIGWVLVDTTNLTSDGPSILVYEDPDHHSRGVPVLWNDPAARRTDILTHDQFEAAMAAQGSTIVRDDQTP